MDRYSLEKFKNIKYNREPSMSSATALYACFNGSITINEMQSIMMKNWYNESFIESINKEHPSNYTNNVKKQLK